MRAEYVQVERPFIDHLQRLGWDYLPGDTGVPYLTERDSFCQVLLADRLREALWRINLDEDGQPWLDDARLTQAVNDLQRLDEPKLMAANKRATRLLIKGTQVIGPDADNPKAVPVHYIDYAHPERNDFLVVNQFRVDPPWAAGSRDYIVPDLVLFVNGIPLVVVECKCPGVENPLTDAITQLRRYSNQREGVTEPEGAEKPFRYAQLMVGTCFETARLGTVGAAHKHYLAWKDIYPKTSEVSENFGSLNGQELLIEGALRPAHLLDIVRNFTLFTQSGGQLVKIVPRYQQFRAVQKAIERLQREPGQRSGIIWHTQGSGKSLAMVFLIRKMRTLPELRRYKVVLMTDRIKLEDQLAETATLTGEPFERAEDIEGFWELLAQPGAGMVFGMIQKMQEPTGARHLLTDDIGASSGWREKTERRAIGTAQVPGTFPVLNESEEILLLVDEAHRSHTSTLHARLMAALPNAAKIGFTGTPILEQDRKPTHRIFGSFIDTYTLDQSQKDKATVPILYEGRTVEGAVKNGETLDAIFEETFADRTAEEIRDIREQYATSREVMEAEQLIAAKARDMLRHYATTVMPDGFKGQVVAVSRRAAVRYQKALVQARDELVAELEQMARTGGPVPEDLAAALPHLDRIRRLKVATVISGAQNDPPSWKQWTRQSRQGAHVADFKKPFGGLRTGTFDPERGEGYTALLVVVNMLLTGFDAPIEQALYVDRPMQGYELLQAIARVNRTYPQKETGLVVDYVGLAGHLDRALEIYTANDIHDALRPIEDQLPLLRDRYQRVVSLFTARGLSLQDTESCVNALRDARLRARFTVTLREFLQTLNTILPRPEALPYVDDAQQLGLIRTKASKRYRDQHLAIAGAEAKVRQLIDEYVIAQGIDPKVPPIDILAANFEEHVAGLPSPRAQAAEMAFATRHHIRRHWQEDPVYYQKLSERLEEILQTFAENWEAQVEALRELIRSYRDTQEEMSREDRTLRPFLRLLVEAASDGRPAPEERQRLADATVTLVDQIRDEISRVDFWRKTTAQEKLRRRIVRYLDDHDLVPFKEQEPLADDILRTAQANHTDLVS